MKITRDETGALINPIVNDADVKPWFLGDERDVDFSDMARDSRCRMLIGDPPLGAHISWRVLDGVWEFHTAVLLPGRGEWTVEFCAAATRYMFTATDAIELMTRIPQGSLGALTLARRFGFRERWMCQSCWFRGKDVPYTVWSLTMQDWMPADLMEYEAAVEDIERAGLAAKAANWSARRLSLSHTGVG